MRSWRTLRTGLRRVIRIGVFVCRNSILPLLLHIINKHSTFAIVDSMTYCHFHLAAPCFSARPASPPPSSRSWRGGFRRTTSSTSHLPFFPTTMRPETSCTPDSSRSLALTLRASASGSCLRHISRYAFTKKSKRWRNSKYFFCSSAQMFHASFWEANTTHHRLLTLRPACVSPPLRWSS